MRNTNGSLDCGQQYVNIDNNDTTKQCKAKKKVFKNNINEGNNKTCSNNKNQRIYQCDECKYTTNRSNNLKRHVTTMHTRTNQELECCSMKFPCKAAFRAHVQTTHREGFACSTCGHVFCRKTLLKRHQSIHDGLKEFRCPLCDYASTHKSNLERHKKIHSHFVSTEGKNKEKKRRFRVGDIVSVSPDNKNKNKENTRLPPMRLDGKPYKCTGCDCRYSSQVAYEEHCVCCPVQDVVTLSIVTVFENMAKVKKLQMDRVYDKEQLQDFLYEIR